MSSEALAWAFKQDIKPSSVKFTLVALCECANYRTGRIMPSIAHLSEITGQDRKTVITNIAELERRGFITDTGERSGATKQIKVYSAAFGTVPSTEPSQKRNSSKFPPKQSQKRDTEPSREPSSSEAKASSDKRTPAKQNDFPRPDWADASIWTDFMGNRKRKRLPSTATAYRGFLRDIAEQQDAQWPPGRLLEHAAAKGWGSIHNPDKDDKHHGNHRQSSSQRDRGRVDGFTAALRKVANRETDYPFAGNG